MSKCFIGYRKTEDCSGNVAVYLIDGVTTYLDADNGLVPWTGDPLTLQSAEDCVVVTPVCEPISQNLTISDFTLETCTLQTVNFDLIANTIDRGFEGWRYSTDTASSIPALFDIPIPDRKIGSVLILHIASGGDSDFVTRETNILNDISLGLPSGGVGPLQQLGVINGNNDFDIHAYAMESLDTSSGNTISASFPLNTQGTDPLIGVVNWHWIEVERDDGGVLSLENIDTANIAEFVGTGPVTAHDPAFFYNYVSQDGCRTVFLTAGRHVEDGGVVDAEEITDADWADYSAATGSLVELYDTSSMSQSVPNTQCQIGMAAAFLAESTTVDVNLTHNQNSGSGITERSGSFAVPFLCEITECVESSPREADKVDYSSPNCEREFTKTVTGEVNFTLPQGADVTLMPVVDGIQLTASAINATASGDQQIAFTVPVGIVAADSSGSCEINYSLIDNNGSSSGSTADISSLNILLEGV